MQPSIPKYLKVVEPLHHRMADSYSRRVEINQAFDSQSFDHFRLRRYTRRKQLAADVNLSHPKPEFEVCRLQKHPTRTGVGFSHNSKKLNIARTSIIRNTNHFVSYQSPSTILHELERSWKRRIRHRWVGVPRWILCYWPEVSIYSNQANLVQLYDPCGKHPGILKTAESNLMR